MATSFNIVTAYAINQSVIVGNEKIPGIVGSAVDEVALVRASVDEIAKNVFVVLIVTDDGHERITRVMTTPLGEVREFKTAGAALDSIKPLTFADAQPTLVNRIAYDGTPTTVKGRVARYKAKRAEHIIALGNLAYVGARATATPDGPLLIELLERKDAITNWVEKLVASVDALAVSITADGIDPAALVI